jgi:beta-RFAP synthase
MTLVIRTPSRLHVGFIDLNGGLGRLFGSLGIALERPGWVLEASTSARCEAQGPGAGEVRRILETLGGTTGALPAVSIHVRQAIPRHAGLGSGTQLELAVARAVSWLTGERPTTPELARLVRRGKRSGIGIAAFDAGGFVVDAGGPCGGTASQERQEIPPVIFRHPVPEDWVFMVATPAGSVGLSGGPEERVFLDLPPMSEGQAGRISRLVLMKVLPAVMADDVERFGEGITEIQTLVGDHFAPFQGGRYATEVGARITELALKRGAAGVGQSSWGPTVFALVRGEDHAADLAGEVARLLGAEGGNVFTTRAANRGAVWSAGS